MIITRTGAGVNTSDVSVYEEKIWTYWEANGTIAVGSPVCHDMSTDTNPFNPDGMLVIEGNCNSVGAEHRILGTYQGHIEAKLGAGGYSVESVLGISTAGATSDGAGFALTGYAAFDGDIIRILSYGSGIGLSEGTTDINHGDALTIVAAGRYVAGTNTTTGMGAQVWSLGINTLATTEMGVAIFNRCL